MLGRFLLGTVTAGAVVAPAIAGSMTADEARKFVAGKVFAFTCVDGTRGAGRILDDMGAAGAVQFSGSGPVRHIRLPGNTLQIRGQNVCASIKGMPFEPCFNLDKKDERSFRGSVSGLGAFAYCDFQHQGGATMLMARAVARPRATRAAAPAADPSHTEVAARVETPRVERSKVEPVKAEPAKVETKSESAKSDVAPELRRSTD
ncbi:MULTISPECIES: hypothetical protein [Bradyrhizobium]|jgi:hypothetical protein|uniref:Uncharacterized protein n=1 Tax=Bradyrhizobium denitrificans TaxID=2734912 RepID=A0ABS5G9H5_9BRAD|nr:MULTISPECIES: hypothetical protein [Bradyrhizobium]RTL96977.1 MAG: hypothetical protein EKK32_21840 [Bradyrhizobiaceae bacterium]MBR1137989.1 hypothetical protein [Bradyrhizobium denitrificans]MCL8482831.1 hypothetical protein [Bradyrhizobium denitrificans]MDU0957997.1 hypothetical protein [Bradyrhizobium sp.]MDU1493509.1 hypothetical protein [Bradyrhizobium sp.]